MDDRSVRQRYPSLEEFKGWYNLGYERPDGLAVLHSQNRVPEFEHGEFFQLYVSENPWFEQLVSTSDLKPFDPIAEPAMFVRSSADDRTLEVYPDFDYLTVELIRRIQKEFLGRHPLWRVILMADDPLCSIVIYPEATRYGNLPCETEPEAALHEIVTRAVALRAARTLPARAQLAFIQQKLPEAIRTIGDQPFVVLGVLDNLVGDYDWLVICLLVRGANTDAYELRGHAGLNERRLSKSGGFGIDPNGTVISGSEIHNAAAFNVALWNPRADYRGPITILDVENLNRFTYDLKTEDITRSEPAE